MLDELDRELMRRGHRYVRYADDCNICVRSEPTGRRVMKSITRFITAKLKLKMNDLKSAVARPQERKFLGFSFTDGPEVRRVIAPKALDRFKGQVREITRRARGVSIETTMADLAPYMRGWRSYFLSQIRRSAQADGGVASNQIRQRQAIISLDIPEELGMTLGQTGPRILSSWSCASLNSSLPIPSSQRGIAHFRGIVLASDSRAERRRLARHFGIPYSSPMSPLRARVEKGRLEQGQPK